MTDEERLKLLEDMREAFRKARPDLNLPPARRDGGAPQQTARPGSQPASPSASRQVQQASPKAEELEEERRDDVQRKLKALRETGREQPNTIVGMLKRFIGRNDNGRTGRR